MSAQRNYDDLSANQILDILEEEYKGDKEALEAIARERKDVEYLLKREKDKNYDGQSAWQHASFFADSLEYWN